MSEALFRQRVGQIAPTPMSGVLERSHQLNFPLVPVGRSSAPTVPQVVGDWWLEPLSAEAYLPPRARMRLEQLFEAGIHPKAIVVFHELPRQAQPSKWAHLQQRMARFASVDMPTAALRSGQLVRQHGPVILRTAALITGFALSGIALLSVATIAAALTVTDPCLVIVTEDDYWIEIDFWF